MSSPATTRVAILLFFSLLHQLNATSDIDKPSASDTDKPSATYDYHMLVQSIGGETGMPDSNGTYTWKYDDFGPCTATCSGGKHAWTSSCVSIVLCVCVSFAFSCFCELWLS